MSRDDGSKGQRAPLQPSPAKYSFWDSLTQGSMFDRGGVRWCVILRHQKTKEVCIAVVQNGQLVMPTLRTVKILQLTPLPTILPHSIQADIVEAALRAFLAKLTLLQFLHFAGHLEAAAHPPLHNPPPLPSDSRKAMPGRAVLMAWSPEGNIALLVSCKLVFSHSQALTSFSHFKL